MITEVDRFHEERHWIINPDSKCWEWQGSLSIGGYGVVSAPLSKHKWAHRIMWEYHNGKVPNGLFVLHKCDNPKCINIEHLFLGTQRDNIHDMIAKGRDNMLRNKLTEDDVRFIRSELSAGRSRGSLAKQFNVINKTIANIDYGKSWRWLP